MRVGFLGLGAIGAPMATHLAKRYSLTVWNRTRARATEFAALHGARAASPRWSKPACRPRPPSRY